MQNACLEISPHRQKKHTWFVIMLAEACKTDGVMMVAGLPGVELFWLLTNFNMVGPVTPFCRTSQS